MRVLDPEKMSDACGAVLAFWISTVAKCLAASEREVFATITNKLSINCTIDNNFVYEHYF